MTKFIEMENKYWETICEMCGPSGDGSMNYEDYIHSHKQFKIPT